ncbi:MAG TPA: hypothetical protein VFG95_10550 [Nitrospiria bacterium]|nr:hypothetical protein [Nitrospiria bacterium]
MRSALSRGWREMMIAAACIVAMALVDTARVSAGVSTSSLLTQRNFGGGVLVEAMLLDAAAGKERVSFRVRLDAGKGSLEGYDLTKISRLRTDRGVEFPTPILEKIEGAGHHIIGTLDFANRDHDGNAILTHETRFIELLISNVAGVPERMFRWEFQP